MYGSSAYRTGDDLHRLSARPVLSNVDEILSACSHHPVPGEQHLAAKKPRKRPVQASIDSLPTYQYPGGKSSDVSSLSLSKANERLARLGESIRVAGPLYEVVTDKDSRDEIHSWLGDGVYNGMMAKARDMRAAALEGVALKSRTDTLQADAAEAEQRRKEEVEERAHSRSIPTYTAAIPPLLALPISASHGAAPERCLLHRATKQA